MENKLEELTRKLYDEGLEKGRADADKLVSDAKDEAARLVSEARSEADAIVKAAEAKAEELHKNSLTEISLAGKQVVAELKKQIADLIVAKSTTDNVKKANMDADFVKNIFRSAICRTAFWPPCRAGTRPARRRNPHPRS